MGVVRISRIQCKSFWPATQLYPHNDWTGWQNCVNYDVCAQSIIVLDQKCYLFHHTRNVLQNLPVSRGFVGYEKYVGQNLRYTRRLLHQTFDLRCFFHLSDVNECLGNSHDCDVLATCNNTFGSYKCLCSAGYTGNGTVCTGEVTDVTFFIFAIWHLWKNRLPENMIEWTT